MVEEVGPQARTTKTKDFAIDRQLSGSSKDQAQQHYSPILLAECDRGSSGKHSTIANFQLPCQPMDQGVIQNLKVHYRQLFLRRRITAIDAKADFEFNLLNSINLLHRAWRHVKPETLKNCFRKAGFHAQMEVGFDFISRFNVFRLRMRF